MKRIVFDYVKNIASYIVFMKIILIILPENKYRGYISTILGFILIFIMISPFKDLSSEIWQEDLQTFSQKYSIENEISVEQAQTSRDELIKKQFEQQLLLKINYLIKGENVSAEKIEIEYIIENGSIEAIEKINLYINGDCEKENIKNIISDFYKIDSGNINIID